MIWLDHVPDPIKAGGTALGQRWATSEERFHGLPRLRREHCFPGTGERLGDGNLLQRGAGYDVFISPKHAANLQHGQVAGTNSDMKREANISLASMEIMQPLMDLQAA